MSEQKFFVVFFVFAQKSHIPMNRLVIFAHKQKNIVIPLHNFTFALIANIIKYNRRTYKLHIFESFCLIIIYTQ